MHEGVPETLLNHPRLQQLAISERDTDAEVPVVTVSRNLPMRFPTFMHALPELPEVPPERARCNRGRR